MNTTARNLALAAAAVLAVSFYFPADALPQVGVCQFKNLTGLPCPGCGLTHSFCAISHGDFFGAWNFNPFGFIFYTVTIGLLLSPLLLKIKPDWGARLTRSRALFVSVPVLVAAMLIFGAVRIATILHAG